jgi:Fe-S-cluster containining protein
VSYRKLKYLYTRIPSIDCKGLCHPSCTVVMAEKVETRRIRECTGSNPFNPSRILRKIQISIDEGSVEIPSCESLKNGRCSIYPFRPAICRLYGVAEGLECEFGCRPERYLTKEEAHQVLKDVRDL